eukprot:TRINITY_DN7762_c0_g2_i2.p1 TRINITY_DN7762_c0_g2~~TRINITY_DN7762_c0_g2_i2.p1  ORF type:complete len:537 (+),score=88.32 TRINITY_DN7762_c0_g2_i2:70-1680(+)
MDVDKLDVDAMDITVDLPSDLALPLASVDTTLVVGASATAATATATAVAIATATATAGAATVAAAAATAMDVASANAGEDTSLGGLIRAKSDVCIEASPQEDASCVTQRLAPDVESVPCESPEAAARAKFSPAPAWDAHLDNPPADNPSANKMAQALRRANLGLTSDAATRFIESVEFISLGCFCAASNALQLMGLKRNTYPFDWVRSSIDGVIHCLDSHFEDFLTYSTYNVQGAYIVFGGTRWGGSFWHHNLEFPVTRTDMARRALRLYGRGNVSPMMPRLFVRVLNSSKEIDAAFRLYDALQRTLPETEELFLLLMVDLQAGSGAARISGHPRGRNILVYCFSEQETVSVLGQAPNANSFQMTSEHYSKGIAFAIKFWAGESRSIEEQVQVFPDLRTLSRSMVQFDGGDPGRDLFTPRKFFGQELDFSALCADASTMDVCQRPAKMSALLSRCRSQVFMVPERPDVNAPFIVECFGKRLSIALPPESITGHVLQIWLVNEILSCSFGALVDGQLNILGQAGVQEIDITEGVCGS